MYKHYFSDFDDFRKTNIDAASCVSAWLLTHPEYLPYKFHSAFAFNYDDGSEYTVHYSYNATGIVLKLYPHEDSYRVVPVNNEP